MFYSGACLAASPSFDEQLADLDKLFDTDVPLAISRAAELESQLQQMSREQQGRLLTLKGVSLLYLANHDDALNYFQQALSVVDLPNEKANIFGYQATAYLSKADYKLALQAMSKNLELIDNINQLDGKRKSYLRLASLYNAMGSHDSAGTYAAKALSLSGENDVKDSCGARLYLAVQAMEQNLLTQAYQDFSTLHDYCELNGVPLVAVIAQKGMGDVKYRAGDYRQSITHLLDALSGYQKFQYQLEISHVQAMLSQDYLALGELATAQTYAAQVVSLPEDSSYQEIKRIGYQVLSELSAQQGQFEQAYAYAVLQQHYKQLVLDEAKVKALAYQAARFNSDEKEREIKLLNKERELYLAQQSIKERERTNMLMFLTLLVGGVFFLGILVAVGTMQKRKYMRLAKMDGLTGIYNRSAGQDLGEDLFVQVLTRGGEFSVILFDLDHFKKINDCFGHATGDWALKKVVEMLKSVIRSEDIFSRIGGEEFAILLPNTSEIRALAIAEQCRAKIAAIDTHFSGHEFELSASFGVSSMTADDLSLDPLFTRADSALYAAKHRGRNTVLAYEQTQDENQQAVSKQSKLVLT